MLTELNLVVDGLEKILAFVEQLDPALKSNSLVMDLQKALDGLKALGL